MTTIGILGIVGVIVSVIILPILIWLLIKIWKEQNTISNKEFGATTNGGVLKELYKPFIRWIFLFIIVLVFCILILSIAAISMEFVPNKG